MVMEDIAQNSVDHRGVKLQNIIQKLSEHCDINYLENLEAVTGDKELTNFQIVPGTKRKNQDGIDPGCSSLNGSYKEVHHTTANKRTDENINLKMKCDGIESVKKNGHTVEILSELPRERISERIKSFKCRKASYIDQDWVNPDQIKVCGGKIPTSSNRKSSQDENTKTVTPKSKQRKKQASQSVEEYVNKAPVIQVGNLVGLRRCYLCAVMFVEKEELINHIKAVHGLDDKITVKTEKNKNSQNEEKVTDEKPFKCLQCESSFRKNSGLKQHVTRQHTQNAAQNSNPCKSDQVSSKSTGSKSTDRPYLCQICGKAFKRKHHLQEHSYIHSVDKPFKCDACSKTFNQRICLTKHLPCRADHERRKRRPNTTATVTATDTQASEHRSKEKYKIVDVKALDVEQKGEESPVQWKLAS